MNFHRTVLLQETIDGLKVVPGEKYIDATLGGGGHTEEILRRGGEVLAIDTDLDAINYVKGKISSSKLHLAHGNFRDIKNIAIKNRFEKVSGIVFDLGVSSHQIDSNERGFSYQQNGPLDMRMDSNSPIKAADLVNLLNKNELSDIFYKFGEESNSRAISNAIVSARKIGAIQTTNDLVTIIARVYKIPEHRLDQMKRTRIAKKIFQALRIAVNNELDVLREALNESSSLFLPKGRLGVITFHSLEDRIVKNAFIDFEKRGLGIVVNKKHLLPSRLEMKTNKRSRSAKLRFFEKN
ncbi:MAG: 16S rRNA (cytosine(1402)-N(4))-methyltransferase RsmH [Candidatus Levybacteria bacterium]|nr:16S rRNA (cytosine(1402)-N(4))-methyltransferase RsmH [Candidatus Levybacteria bacterium]